MRICVRVCMAGPRRSSASLGILNRILLVSFPDENIDFIFPSGNETKFIAVPIQAIACLAS